MIKKITICCLLLGIFTCTDDVYALPRNDSGWVLMEAGSRRVLSQSNGDVALPMASTTKIVSAIVALESGVPLDTPVTITPEMTRIEGSSLYLSPGEVYTLRELLYGMLLNSANDASVAVAIAVGGSVEGFAGKMNEMARELGLKNCRFANPHGLDDPSHYTSAADLAVITAHALENPEFARAVSTQKYVIPADETHAARYLSNHNRLLRQYQGAVGVKTGFTKRSGRCLVSAAERDGLRLICVTLNVSDDWNEHTKMLDGAFDSYERVEVAKAGELRYSIPVAGGKGGAVTALNGADVALVLPKEADASLFKATVELPQVLFGSVEKGRELGKVKFEYDGSMIGEAVLIANNDVIVVVKPSVWERIFRSSK